MLDYFATPPERLGNFLKLIVTSPRRFRFLTCEGMSYVSHPTSHSIRATSIRHENKMFSHNSSGDDALGGEALVEEAAPEAFSSADREHVVEALDVHVSDAESFPSVPSSQHTSSFAELLEQLGISIAVTTYQAGKLVLLRAIDGTINTHFCGFDKPMGLAVDGDRLAIGTAVEIWEYHNAPAATRALSIAVETSGGAGEVVPSASESPGTNLDACFLPRGSHTTGDIQIHEMTWSNNELWFINTRFSCLCTRDMKYSFVPRWRPPFVSAIAPEDRCHLNGMCEAPRQPDDAPRFFVTALGETNEPTGWRKNKGAGGILMATDCNEVMLRCLSMPHSPRWYADQLWLLESGNGTFGRVDLQAGRYEPVASLPGFTRGIDFCGQYAFIGLSQVRESAIFSGISIAERPVSERSCGVCVVDLLTGQTVAWLKFDDCVQEIFAVTVLPNSRSPDLINDRSDVISDTFLVPDEALSSVPEDIRFVTAVPD